MGRSFACSAALVSEVWSFQCGRLGLQSAHALQEHCSDARLWTEEVCELDQGSVWDDGKSIASWWRLTSLSALASPDRKQWNRFRTLKFAGPVCKIPDLFRSVSMQVIRSYQTLNEIQWYSMSSDGHEDQTHDTFIVGRCRPKKHDWGYSQFFRLVRDDLRPGTSRNRWYILRKMFKIVQIYYLRLSSILFRDFHA